MYYIIICQSSLYQERKMSKKLKALLMHGTYNYVYSLPVLIITGIKDFPKGICVTFLMKPIYSMVHG